MSEDFQKQWKYSKVVPKVSRLLNVVLTKVCLSQMPSLVLVPLPYSKGKQH